MRSLTILGTGIVVGYVIRSRRNATFANVAHRIVDVLFGQSA